ncbi:putative Dolichyl-phosphate beta-glucosyltransferase [Hibiscus syriacus]|uniref:Dolichyl-phosphate beta-glucosyltransferase n=1 Tax=Hibiscus syriacus TaxID=106335 RepID=A0A6A2WHN3_HIBSY|nr:putative Dolichyl-phosphate beta-glucosyltransferase [Hibiscus syriacus]
MGSLVMQEFKKQASFFFKEKIKTARLALTDVTPVQLLTEEATDGTRLSQSICNMDVISRAAFEVDDYWRIVESLHKRLEFKVVSKFDARIWRESYNALVLLEHLLTHGPLRVAEEFQPDKSFIKQMANSQYIDDKRRFHNKNLQVQLGIEGEKIIGENLETTRKRVVYQSVKIKSSKTDGWDQRLWELRPDFSFK